MRKVKMCNKKRLPKILLFLMVVAVLFGNVQVINAEEIIPEETVTEEAEPEISENVLNVIQMIDEVPDVEQLQSDFEANRNHGMHIAAIEAAKAKIAEAANAYEQLPDEDKVLVTNAWELGKFTLIPTPTANTEVITVPVEETSAHVFMHSRNNPYYQHSPHDDRRMYLLVDTSLYGNQEWKPDGGPYDPSVPYNAETGEGNNFVAVYCCDADTGYREGTYYERINLEDAGYYSEDAAAHIRAVVMNAYPFISGDEMRDRLDLMDGADDGKITNKVFKFKNESLGIMETGFTGETVEVNVDEIEDAELLTAVQHVIWGYSNYTDDNDGLTMDAYTTHQYDRTVNVEDVIYYPVLTKYYQYESNNKEAYDDQRKNNISAVAQYLCEKLAPEPIGENAGENQKSQIIISDVSIEKIEPVLGKKSVYRVLVNIKLQSRNGTAAIGGEAGDDITIKVTSRDIDGNLVSDGTAERKADGNSEYQLQINVVKGGKVEVDVCGTQYLPLGAYFYAAYDEDGEPEGGESGLNPGQLEAQNFVGVAMGNTKIQANASKTFTEEVKETELTIRKTDKKGNVIAGAEFTLSYMGENEIILDTQTVNDETTGQITFEGLLAGKSYILQESKVPEGYQAVEPIKFQIVEQENGTLEIVYDTEQQVKDGVLCVVNTLAEIPEKPEEPQKPQKPEEPKEKPKEESKKEEPEKKQEEKTAVKENVVTQAPHTGDNNSLGYLLIILICAVLGFVGIILLKKRNVK